MSLDLSQPLVWLLPGLLVLSAALTWLLLHIRVLDVPNARSSHTRLVPRLGGVAIVVSFLAGIAVAALDGFRGGAVAPIAAAIATATAVAAAGLLDDLQRLPSFKLKLAAQVAAAAVLVAAGVSFDRVAVPLAGPVELGIAGPVLTVLWLVGMTNAVNFMDGLDGLVGGTCLIAALALGGLSLAAGEAVLPLVCLLLAPCILGFLAFNFPRARIFMGDTGSQFLGFLLAALAVAGATQEASALPVLVMPLLLFHFIFDTSFTVVRRLIQRERIAEAHRSHLYQLVNRMGASHAAVSLAHYAATVVLAGAALVMLGLEPPYQAVVFVPFLILEGVYAAVVIRMARQKGLLAA